MDIPQDIQTMLDIALDMYIDHVLTCNACGFTYRCGDGEIFQGIIDKIRKNYPKAVSTMI